MADKPPKPSPAAPTTKKPSPDMAGLIEHIARARKSIASTRELLKPRGKDDQQR